MTVKQHILNLFERTSCASLFGVRSGPAISAGLCDTASGLFAYPSYAVCVLSGTGAAGRGRLSRHGQPAMAGNQPIA